MGDRWTDRDKARQQQRRVVVWGCNIHRTPAGTQCQGCADQGELLTRDEVYRDRRRQR
ncbi:MAG: hypothetical protein ACRDRR_19905 [Pseudonocardiaceae bacterium]